MARDPIDRWRELGTFIREQRSTARLSLRRLSELAGISNPYLSQIERGLRRPSADILQQIARALRISAETLYVQAGILDPPADGPDLVREIRADPYLGESQKQALVQIYLSFRKEHEKAHAEAHAGAHAGAHDHAHAEEHEKAHEARPDHAHAEEHEKAHEARPDHAHDAAGQPPRAAGTGTEARAGGPAPAAADGSAKGGR